MNYRNTNLKILMHCFTGFFILQKILDLNSFFSASGIITFKNSFRFKIIHFYIIPNENLIIETDSKPFLFTYTNERKKMNLVIFNIH